LAGLNVSASPAPRVGDAPDGLDALLDRYPTLTPPVTTAGAAVTIILREGLREVETLLIVRATNPNDPASGHVAFPGGRVGDEDTSLLATALRELEEEVGLSLADLHGPPRYVGTMFTRRFGLHVGVFAAALGPVARHPVAQNVMEVAHIFWLPRSTLGITRSVSRETPVGPLVVNATVVDGQVLWGFTRRVLREFFGLPTEDELAGPAFAHVDSRDASPTVN
jgi:8-oxo-dGTP pyrophosphatase MutT (NUDIX family)